MCTVCKFSVEFVTLLLPFLKFYWCVFGCAGSLLLCELSLVVVRAG